MRYVYVFAVIMNFSENPDKVTRLESHIFVKNCALRAAFDCFLVTCFQWTSIITKFIVVVIRNVKITGYTKEATLPELRNSLYQLIYMLCRKICKKSTSQSLCVYYLPFRVTIVSHKKIYTVAWKQDVLCAFWQSTNDYDWAPPKIIRPSLQRFTGTFATKYELYGILVSKEYANNFTEKRTLLI